MNSKQNLGQNWRGILTQQKETALDGARTARYALSAVVTLPILVTGLVWHYTELPLRRQQTASNLKLVFPRTQNPKPLKILDRFNHLFSLEPNPRNITYGKHIRNQRHRNA